MQSIGNILVLLESVCICNAYSKNIISKHTSCEYIETIEVISFKKVSKCEIMPF